jgi:hypothetical protein
VLKNHQALSSDGIQAQYLESAKRLKRRSSTELFDFKTTSGIQDILPEETPVPPMET